ncbi:6-phosphogluconolactonase [Candidatus Similichlamydia epinepheli]|uniref:6-phosphogluconolactonase n=1 Tax=Candidatus Similichlamydia epinepheli TaxID=1903953 RepID=UPI000D3AC135|nr:6-phosphogluconolactonase [Candidatus Similichlamydia epinepheli]
MEGASFIVPGSLEETIDWTAQSFYDYVESTIQKKGICRVAVSGGTTPLPLFRTFSRSANLEIWSSVEWFWNDERYVPIEDEESNFGNAFSVMNTLEGCQFFPMVSNSSLHPEELADTYSNTIEDKLPFDLSILGIGEDGHFASFFPNHPVFLSEKKLLEEGSEMPLVEALKVEEKGWRISLSIQSILTSSQVWVLVTGLSKKSIMNSLLQKRDDSLPANLLIGKKNVLFILDNNSSSELELENVSRD